MAEKYWSDANRSKLTKLWTEGKSASEISSILPGSPTRNAVIGQVHRMRLPKREQDRKIKGTPGPRKPRTEAEQVRAVALRTTIRPPAPKPKPVPLIKPEPFELKPGEKVTIFHLSSNTCKWPIGDPVRPDFHFCGNLPRQGSPYCAFHANESLPPWKRADA